MTTPSKTTSAGRIRRFLSGETGLYANSVIEEAGRLLDDLLDTAERHGHTDRASTASGWLVQAAAEATAAKYGRPAVDRTSSELAALSSALREAFTAEGLVVVPCQVRMGVAVAPVLPGPTWGMDGRTGLAVSVFADSGWELMVNQPRTRVFSIHAPDTAEGACEVAAIVHGVLRGEIDDPFRRR